MVKRGEVNISGYWRGNDHKPGMSETLSVHP